MKQKNKKLSKQYKKNKKKEQLFKYKKKIKNLKYLKNKNIFNHKTHIYLI